MTVIRLLGVVQNPADGFPARPLVDFRARLHDKCRLRNVDFEGPEDFFDQRIVDDVERGWEDSLGASITDLPFFARVMDELRPQVEALLGPVG